jgi:hypothetical protein
MATCDTLMKLLDNALELTDEPEGTNMTGDLLRAVVHTYLKRKSVGKDFKEKMKGQIKSPGRKILEYMQSRGFSGFRQSWQRLKEGGENMLVFTEDLI